MGRGWHKSDPDGGRQPALHLRVVPTYNHRLRVVQHFTMHGMESTLATFYKDIVGKRKATAKKNIYLWAKDKAGIEFVCASGSGDLTRVRKPGTGSTLPPEAEQHIVQWLNRYRVDGLPVSSLMLERKALAVARDLDIHPPYFAASWAWCRGFLRRHRLSLRARTRQGQVRPADAQAARKAFNTMVKQKMAEYGVDVVYNTDQTPIFFEYLPKSTINEKGSHTVWVCSGGKDKERLMCMILGDSFGRKYPPFLVVKSKPSSQAATRVINTTKRHGFGRQLWETLEPLQGEHSVRIYSNATGWWVEEISLAFLRYHLGSRPNKKEPVLLLWDDFSAHWTPAVQACAKELNVELIRAPPGCTSVCQPADVAWNRPLKARLRRYWIEYLESQMEEHARAMREATPFRFSPPSRSVVVGWVSEAWKELTSDTIANGFNGVLQESALIDSEQAEMDTVIAHLESCSLLDDSIGEVSLRDDIVEGVRRQFENE